MQTSPYKLSFPFVCDPYCVFSHIIYNIYRKHPFKFELKIHFNNEMDCALCRLGLNKTRSWEQNQKNISKNQHRDTFDRRNLLVGIKLNDVYEFYVSLKCNAFVNRPAASCFTISYITLGGNFAFSKIKKRVGWNPLGFLLYWYEFYIWYMYINCISDSIYFWGQNAKCF